MRPSMLTNLVKNHSDRRQSRPRTKLGLSSKNKEPNFNLGLWFPYLSGEENTITYFSVIKAERHQAKCKVINFNVLYTLINADLAGVGRDRHHFAKISHCDKKY